MPDPSEPAVAIAGRLLLARPTGFTLFDLATRREASFHQFAAGQFVASPAISRDGKQIAFTLFAPPSNPGDLGGSDLYLMDVATRSPRLLRAHDPPSSSFENPCWSADGAAVFVTVRAPVVVGGQLQGESTTIQRLDLADPRALHRIADGQAPSTSADGRSLVYLVADPQSGWRLRLARVDGSGAVDLLGSQRSSFLNSPRVAPDGSSIAFAGVGLSSRTSASGGPANLIAALLGPAIAEADGTPADIFTIRPDSSQLQQITHLQDHTPAVAWSPDSRWLALISEQELAVLDPTGHDFQRLGNGTLASSIAWLP